MPPIYLPGYQLPYSGTVTLLIVPVVGLLHYLFTVVVGGCCYTFGYLRYTTDSGLHTFDRYGLLRLLCLWTSWPYTLRCVYIPRLFTVVAICPVARCYDPVVGRNGWFVPVTVTVGRL